MKRTLLSLFILCAAALAGAGQTTMGKVTVNARQDLLSVLPAEAAYFLPQFEDATVFFTDGTASGGRVNICLVDNSVRFIQDSGDTLLLSSPDRVLRILAADTLILRTEDCFVKQIAVYGKTTLGERRRLTLDLGDDRTGGYGALPATSTAVGVRMSDIDPYRQFEVKTDIAYALKKDFVLTDGEKVFQAGIPAFNRLFPDRKKEIRSFVKEHRTDFNDKQDLADLFFFCIGEE